MLVGYARVSTLDQNPQLQIDALKQAGCERLYVEKASGAHRDRPELKAALEYMRPGDTLVVWRLSRLARSLKQIIETAHELEQKKQALKVLTRNIDTGTPEGRLFFHITAAFDEFQRELIVENTKAGLAAARKRGRRGGRPRVLDKEKTRARRGDAQGHGELPVRRGCHRSPQDRQDGLLPIFPARSYPGTPESRPDADPRPCRFTYLCVKEPRIITLPLPCSFSNTNLLCGTPSRRPTRLPKVTKLSGSNATGRP